MKFEETTFVEPTDARPAGPPDECFYCGRKIGDRHKDNCVIVSKSVVVRVTFDVVIAVPNFWNKDNIEFHYNDGSWCSDNIIT